MDSYIYVILVAVVVAVPLYFSLAKKKNLVHLSPSEFKKFKLVDKFDVISPDVGCHTILFRFGLPSNSGLSLPCGQHISIKGFNEEKKMIVRQYTPTSNENTLGHFDVIVKIYPNGQMGNYLKNLPLGTYVDIKGPNGHLNYKGNGLMEIRRRDPETNAVKMVDYKIKNIAMIAGGSGITPMLQVIRTISEDMNDPTSVKLVYGNRTPGDIMCRNEIEQLAERNKKFQYHFTVDTQPEGHWPHGVGYITEDVLRAQLAGPNKDLMIFLCGPPPMINLVVDSLVKIGHSKDLIFSF